MTPFAYRAAATPAEAVSMIPSDAAFIAGGTDLIQLMREGIATPTELVDINGLGLAGIVHDDDWTRIGAVTRLSDVAGDASLKERFPAVAEAIEATASGQVRNMATVGGNLLQRTRCLYFRDPVVPCNKRQPGSGCPAREGRNRHNAILGGSAHCIAAHPSDLAVALVACGAEIILLGPSGERTSLLEDFFRPPGDTPEIETILAPDELVISVRLPRSEAQRRSRFLKIRDRASFEWALVSCAASVSINGNEIADARLAAGGVATMPWRLRDCEQLLIGRQLSEETVRKAADLAADGAEPCGRNAFKVAMLKAAVRRCLLDFKGQR